MAQQTPILVKTFVNAAGNTDVAAKRICVFDGTNGGAKMAAASTDLKFVGISAEDENTTSHAFGVITHGIATVTAGGTVAKGDEIEADSAGKGVAVSSVAFGGSNNKLIVGNALSGAASGEDFDLLIQPKYHRP